MLHSLYVTGEARFRFRLVFRLTFWPSPSRYTHNMVSVSAQASTSGLKSSATSLQSQPPSFALVFRACLALFLSSTHRMSAPFSHACEDLLSPTTYLSPSLSSLPLPYCGTGENPKVYSSVRTTRSLSLLPVEILDEVALCCLQFQPETATKTLIALSICCTAFTLPAQRTLVREISLSDSDQIEKLTATLAKTGLGRACRVLTLRTSSPKLRISKDRNATRITSQEAQEIALSSLRRFALIMPSQVL